jgi:hypothetical protein
MPHANLACGQQRRPCYYFWLREGSNEQETCATRSLRVFRDASLLLGGMMPAAAATAQFSYTFILGVCNACHPGKSFQCVQLHSSFICCASTQLPHVVAMLQYQSRGFRE